MELLGSACAGPSLMALENTCLPGILLQEAEDDVRMSAGLLESYSLLNVTTCLFSHFFYALHAKDRMLTLHPESSAHPLLTLTSELPELLQARSYPCNLSKATVRM